MRSFEPDAIITALRRTLWPFLATLTREMYRSKSHARFGGELILILAIADAIEAVQVIYEMNSGGPRRGLIVAFPFRDCGVVYRPGSATVDPVRSVPHPLARSGGGPACTYACVRFLRVKLVADFCRPVSSVRAAIIVSCSLTLLFMRDAGVAGVCGRLMHVRDVNYGPAV